MERNGEVLGTTLKTEGEGRAFLKRVDKGRIKEGFALALGLAGSGGAVRTPRKGLSRCNTPEAELSTLCRSGQVWRQTCGITTQD